MVLFMMKIFLIILLLRSWIDATPTEDSTASHEKMIKLLLSCFADRLKTVITTPNFIELIDRISRYSETMITTISIDENYKATDIQPIMLQLGTFILPAHSVTSFKDILETVKASPWWHINSLFFIIGTSLQECEVATEILKQCWKMNLLSSIFLCSQNDKGVMLYTYNPYTSRAPQPWKKVENVEKTNDRWTLYVQNYFEGQKHCASLEFDKMKFMDGYAVKGVANTKRGTEWTENKDYDMNSLLEKHSFYGEAMYFHTIFSAANMSLIVNYDSEGYFDNGKAVGFLSKIINGSYDISLAGRPLTYNLSATYPRIQAPLRILTQQRNFLRPEEKIVSFYSPEVWYLTAIVLSISFIFILIVYKKRKFALAAFDVLRLLLSVGIDVPFIRTSTRIFFIGIFHLFIVLNATFQGNIAAFLTKPERPYIENMDDLQKFHSDIYSPIFNKDSIDEMESAKNSIHFISDIDCGDFVVKNFTAACIEFPSRMLALAAKHNLHVSKKDIYETYFVHWCRDDWTLLKKFDIYSSRFIEAGLYEYWVDNMLTVPMEKLRANEMKETEPQYRPITLDDLAFAFRILGVGLGLSILVFLVEVIQWKKFLRVVKKMGKKQKKHVKYFVSKFKLRK